MNLLQQQFRLHEAIAVLYDRGLRFGEKAVRLDKTPRNQVCIADCLDGQSHRQRILLPPGLVEQFLGLARRQRQVSGQAVGIDQYLPGLELPGNAPRSPGRSLDLAAEPQERIGAERGPDIEIHCRKLLKSYIRRIVRGGIGSFRRHAPAAYKQEKDDNYRVAHTPSEI